MNFLIKCHVVSRYWEMYDNIAECNTINYTKKTINISLY